MMDITIVAVDQLRSDWAKAAAEQYLKYLKPYARVRMVEVPRVKFAVHSRQQAMAAEAERLEKVLAKAEGRIWLLDEAGKAYDSLKFADRLAGRPEPLVLVLGGALGLDSGLKRRFPDHLSLSPLTLPHELARVVLLEQLYRAATLNQQKTYHY